MAEAQRLADSTPARIAGLRERGALIAGSDLDLAIISVTGADAERFLQAQTTNDLSDLFEGAGQMTALLDRKAHVIACFHLYRLGDRFLILADRELAGPVIEHLNRFIFADKVEIEPLEGVFELAAVQGVLSNLLLHRLLPESLNAEKLAKSATVLPFDGDAELVILRLSMTGEEGFVALAPKEKAQALFERLSSLADRLHFARLDRQALETARLEAGILKPGKDYDENNLMPETVLDEEAVSYSKGCFQGQEVLARVRSHGAPARAIVGLTIEPSPVRPFPPGTEIEIDGKPAAWLKTNDFSPTAGKFLAIALVKREFRVPDRRFDATIDGEPFSIVVHTLPFYRGKDARRAAKGLYERALQSFAGEDDSLPAEKSTAISLLREAIELDPTFEDAYESLGVILDKRGRVDEAIEWMKRLASLNPDSYMAHTNLSVFYLEKGSKEEAEEEKAISMSIQMSLAARQAAKETKSAEQRREEEEETRRRMEMFSQVLEIDADDLLANYGMGDCLVALGSFAEAVPYLEKALHVKESHAVAYLALGRAFEGLGEKEKAKATYDRGIEVSARRGDMEPMKKMQERLAGLRDKAVLRAIAPSAPSHPDAAG